MSADYPELDIDTGRIYAGAGEIRRLGVAVHDLGVEADRRWQGLGVGYAAPETPDLLRFPADRIVPRGENTRDGTDGVAQALTDFADDVGPWLVALRGLVALPRLSDAAVDLLLAQIHELESTCARAIRAAIGRPGPTASSGGPFDSAQLCYPPPADYDQRRGVGPAGPLAPLAEVDVVGSGDVTGRHLLDAVTGATRGADLDDTANEIVVLMGRNGASVLLQGGRPEFAGLYPVGTTPAQIAAMRFPPSSRVVVLQEGVAGAKAIYSTDAQGRVVRVELQVGTQATTRSATQNARARLQSGDDAGHLDAAAFGGSREEINLVSQLVAVNRGGPWKRSELAWLAAARAGLPVHGIIDVHYPPDSRRPDEFSRYEAVGGAGGYTPGPTHIAN